MDSVETEPQKAAHEAKTGDKKTQNFSVVRPTEREPSRITSGSAPG